jgi:hypothetical protein
VELDILAEDTAQQEVEHYTAAAEVVDYKNMVVPGGAVDAEADTALEMVCFGTEEV